MAGFDLTKVDVEHMLETLELSNVRRATDDEYLFSCPYPLHADGDSSPSAYMNTGEVEPWKATRWFCHSCRESGDARKLVAYMMDVSPITASRLLRQAYDPVSYDPDEHSMIDWLRDYRKQREQRHAVETSMPQPLPEGLLDAYAVNWTLVEEAYAQGEDVPGSLTYMLERGFLADTLEKWEIGYDSMTDRVVIPVRDHQMNLIGFKGRAWRPDHQPKYLVLGDSPYKAGRFDFLRYEVSKVVFGLGQVEPIDDTLIICEGELNAIALWQKGWFNAVAVNGSNFSEIQAKLIVNNCDRAIVFFDWLKHDKETGELVDDTAGQEGTVRVGDALNDFIHVSVVPPHESDPAEMDADTIRALVEKPVSFRKTKLALAA